MKVLPVDCCSAAATSRPTMSEGPPGVFATTNFTGRSGYAAKADRIRKIDGATAPTALIRPRREGPTQRGERGSKGFVMGYPISRWPLPDEPGSDQRHS